MRHPRPGSTAGYPDASDAQAEDLFTENFQCILDSLAADPGNPQATYTAASPPLPLRTADGTPVDLSLNPTGDKYQFAPANPLVDVALPDDLSREVPVGDRGIALNLGATDPEAAKSATAAPLAGEGLFYANAAPATDVSLSPISPGIEATYQAPGPGEPPSGSRSGSRFPPVSASRGRSTGAPR